MKQHGASTAPASASENRRIEGLPELLERLRRRIQRILFRFGIPTKDAEDLVQVTAMAFLERSREEEILDPGAWFAATLRNQCLMYWRKAHVATEPTLLDFDRLQLVMDHHVQEREHGPRLHLRIDLERATESLRPVETELLRLYLRGERSGREIATAVGLAPSSIGKIRRRALRRLREVLAANYGPADAPSPASSLPRQASNGRSGPPPRPRAGEVRSWSYSRTRSQATPTASVPPPAPQSEAGEGADAFRLMYRIERLERQQELLLETVAEALRRLRRPCTVSFG